MQKLTLRTRSFDWRYSTCSTLKPKLFEWTDAPSDTVVYADDSILEAGRETVPCKYGWIAESPAIVPHLYEIAKNPEIQNCFRKIFTCDRQLVASNPSKFVEVFAGSNLPWCNFMVNPTKDRLCSMFCSAKLMCPGHVKRNTLAFRYMKKLDLFGGAHGSPRVGMNGTAHPDKNILNRYMFSVVMENIQLDNYFTEKLTDCFASKTVPIYWGSPSIGEYFDMRGVILLDPDNPYDVSGLNAEMYQSMLPYVEENYKKVCKLKMSDDQIFEYIQGNSHAAYL